MQTFPYESRPVAYLSPGAPPPAGAAPLAPPASPAPPRSGGLGGTPEGLTRGMMSMGLGGRGVQGSPRQGESLRGGTPPALLSWSQGRSGGRGLGGAGGAMRRPELCLNVKVASALAKGTRGDLSGAWGSGFRVQGSGSRVQGSGFRVQSSEFRFSVQDSGS